MANRVTFALPFWFVNRPNPINQPEPEPNRQLAAEPNAEPEANLNARSVSTTILFC
jgi:hypothetical protein